MDFTIHNSYKTTEFEDWVNYYIGGHTTRVVNGETQWKHEADDIVTKYFEDIIVNFEAYVFKTIDVYEDKTELSEEDKNFGNELWLRCNNGDEYRICHVKQHGFYVKIGDKVSPGSKVCVTGRTGYHYPGTVIHTHIELIS